VGGKKRGQLEKEKVPIAGKALKGAHEKKIICKNLGTLRKGSRLDEGEKILNLDFFEKLLVTVSPQQRGLVEDIYAQGRGDASCSTIVRKGPGGKMEAFPHV